MATNEKPYGITLSPRGHQLDAEEAELQRELAEEREARAKLNRVAQRQRDQIGEMLRCRYYQAGKSFWFIRYKGQPVFVSRYYPERNVAVDIFQKITAVEKQEIDFKRSAFRKANIKYAALDWFDSDAASLLPQITTLRIWPF